MDAGRDGYTTEPFPRTRQLMVDGGRLGRRRHTIHGLVEFDVTLARERMARHKAHTGERLSFTAFFVACLGRALDEDRRLHAYRDWRNRLILFDEVDVNTLFEVEVDGRKMIRPHILRGVNRRGVRALHDEIRAVQSQGQGDEAPGLIDRFVRLPAFIRRPILWALLKSPRRVKAYTGTVLVTSLGMFGSGGGWGIPVPNHTLQLTLGGIGTRPGVVDERVEAREYLSVTISVDHDVVDGAPVARFVQRLKELVESADGLPA